MHTLIILFSCLGFFMLYNTSKRAKLSAAGGLEKWLQAYPKRARQMGVVFILLAIVALVWRDGPGVGAFFALILLMTCAGYMVAIAPLYYLRLKHVAVVALGCLLLELFIF